MDTEYPHGMNILFQGGQQRHTYNGLPNFQSQFQEPSQPGAPTLPPIQSQRPAFNQSPNSFELLPRRQQPPYSSSNLAFAPYASHGLSQVPYNHGISQYQNNSPMFTQPHALSMGQEYAPVGTQGSLPNLRPMPTNESHPGHGLSMSSYGQPPTQGITASNQEHEMQHRTHVVGSQGRRGILPSDEGRPAAVSSGGSSTAKTAVIPLKDSDGKYPCPHCQKTYLHAKHLKRHLLRHTGDRPYSCILCNDTFSRSDILKRHFQKCSIRRGNPTGATHLSNSQSHLKRQAAKRESISSTATTDFNATPQETSPTTGVPLNDHGVGLKSDGTSTGLANGDSSKRFGEAATGKEMQGMPAHPANFSQNNFGVVPGANGHNSLPSSGSSTPLTSKGPNFPQSATPDSMQHQVNPYPSNMNVSGGNRNSMPHMPTKSQGSGNGFDWASYPPNERTIQTNHESGQVDKPDNMSDKSQFHSMPEDQHEEFVSGFYVPRGGSTHGDTLNG